MPILVGLSLNMQCCTPCFNLPAPGFFIYTTTIRLPRSRTKQKKNEERIMLLGVLAHLSENLIFFPAVFRLVSLILWHVRCPAPGFAFARDRQTRWD
jgi:hypothetical protein